MARRSFWEKLGRQVGKGLQKTKELTEQVEGHLDLEKAQEVLEDQEAALGRLVAEDLLGGEGESYVPSAEARDILQKIRLQRDLVARLRAEREAQSAEKQGSEAAPADGAAPTEATPQEGTGEQPGERDVRGGGSGNV